MPATAFASQFASFRLLPVCFTHTHMQQRKANAYGGMEWYGVPRSIRFTPMSYGPGSARYGFHLSLN